MTSPGQGGPKSRDFQLPNFDGAAYRFGLDIDAGLLDPDERGLRPSAASCPAFCFHRLAGVHVTVSYARRSGISRGQRLAVDGYGPTRVPARRDASLRFRPAPGTRRRRSRSTIALRSRTCAPQPASTLAAVVIDQERHRRRRRVPRLASPYPSRSAHRKLRRQLLQRISTTRTPFPSSIGPSPYRLVFYLRAAPAAHPGSTGGVSTPLPRAKPRARPEPFSRIETAASRRRHCRAAPGFTTSVGIHAPPESRTARCPSPGTTAPATSVFRHGVWTARRATSLSTIVSDGAADYDAQLPATSGSWDIPGKPDSDRRSASLAPRRKDDNCDHGTFARPVIDACPLSFSWIGRPSPIPTRWQRRRPSASSWV
jgi:hypothetical protein